MFKCFVTGKNSAPNEKPHKVVVEKRERNYMNEEGDKIISIGWEVAKEVLMTNEGLAIWNAKNGVVK